MYFKTLAVSIFTFTSVTENVLGGCPFEKKVENEAIPNVGVHENLRGRRLAAFKEDETSKRAIASFFEQRKKNRSLQEEERCITTQVVDDIQNSIDLLANSIPDLGQRGHFFGGILRLAAHDFMDFDQKDNSEPGGPDGCLNFSDPANAGLSDLWCDDPIACPFKHLYDTEYADFISKADFWVLSATKVVELTAPARDNLVMNFRWGREDNESCPSSSSRLPEAFGCSEVESTFIDRMGLSWYDATALMGGHTLGRGSINFSGHEGTWVQNDEESVIFDRQYYRELKNRAWVPRQAAAGTDWIWGGRDRNVLMLNTDICLLFDIPEGNDQTCCAMDEGGNCRIFEDNICPTADVVRPESVGAVNEFVSGTRNQNFFNAYKHAWTLATELGHGDNLKDVPDSCSTTDDDPDDDSSEECVDGPPFLTSKGHTKDCIWIIRENKCAKYGDNCPLSCGLCKDA
jgi:hypothetical protein